MSATSSAANGAPRLPTCSNRARNFSFKSRGLQWEQKARASRRAYRCPVARPSSLSEAKRWAYRSASTPKKSVRGLRRIADRLRPLDHGLIIRTEAEGATEAQIAADLAMLGRGLAALDGQRPRSKRAFSLVHEDLGLLGRIARDRLSEDVTSILIDSRAVCDAFTASSARFFADAGARCRFVSRFDAAFRAFRHRRLMCASRASASSPLSGGGSLAIDEAEALTASRCQLWLAREQKRLERHGGSSQSQRRGRDRAPTSIARFGRRHRR